MKPTLGWRVSTFIHNNPRVLVGVTSALVVFSAAQLVSSIGLYLKSVDLCGEIQREASELLGG